MFENSSGEVKVDVSAQGLRGEVAEAGEINVTHSGGDVVLRCTPGRLELLTVGGLSEAARR